MSNNLILLDEIATVSSRPNNLRSDCTCVLLPLPGADQIWTKPSMHWIFVGELHGSNEAPAAFRDLVCDALAHGKHVTVALERPTNEQAALDDILTAKDLPRAESHLLRQPGWKNVLDRTIQ